MGLTKTQSGGLADDAKTTINTNADDRVITGSGTANTLNAESNMTYTSNTLKLQDGVNDTSLLHIVGGGTSNRGLKIGTSTGTGSGQNDGAAVYDAIDSESNAYGAQHRFKIAGTDCFTIGYNGAKGYVGIQDGVPYPDTVGGNNVASHLQLGVPSGLNDRATSIKFIGRDGNANGNKCQLSWAGANNRFDISVNGNQALQIQANKDVEVTDGNLVIGTSGHGIDFSATSGSGTSELFDDYEEGTWTPVHGSNGGSAAANGTYTNQHGSYTKVGNTVHISCYLGWNNNFNGGSGSYAIDLPFTHNSTPNTYAAVSFGFLYHSGGALSNANEQLGGYVYGSKMLLYRIPTGQSTGAASGNNVSNAPFAHYAGYIQFDVTFKV